METDAHFWWTWWVNVVLAAATIGVVVVALVLVKANTSAAVPCQRALAE